MGWAEIRQRARRTVHSAFSLPAIYYPPDGSPGVSCSARMHNEMRTFGDLDREGFAQNIEDVNQVIFDALEVEPEKKGRIDFGTGKVFRIENVLP
jgi:hypothetical protein